MVQHVVKLIALSAALVVGLAAAPGAHANFLAGGTDPPGDASDPNPGRDITAGALSYDRRTGTVRGGVALRGTPADVSRAYVVVLAGVRTPSGCNGYPAIGLSSLTTDPVARWTRLDAAGPPAAEGNAEKDGADELQTFAVTDPALAGRNLDCVTAAVADPANPLTTYDTVGPLRLAPRPQLSAKLGSTPSVLKPGQTRTVRLTLRNPGDASTGRIRLSVSHKRGLTARVSSTVKALRAGQRRTVRVQVTLSGRAKTATPLRITATAGKLRVREEATLYLRKPSKPRADNGSGVCASYAPVFGGGGSIVAYPC